ncbi:uracil nucleotide/cysteinyl leukotriene receptor-like [Megalobrama amblycephala]|uniref:uracil nucleotide/cysteinyl leukotriene receptor-like n=1 Tax=Megalobrama amblycephala TaxID=75352 RepID=UPI0020145A62|nr:uracil nucleotide/cysteinyl leukotriene receptor-like [Megalobrama amblycephala]
MNNSTVNFITPEISTNSTTQPFGLINFLITSIYSIHFLFSIPTHSYVIWLIITGTESGVVSAFFNLHLSICEIVNCLHSLVSILTIYFSSLSFLMLFLQGLILSGRPVFQCLICVERYLAVVHPVTFLKYKPLRYRVICCTVAWIIILGSCFYCLFIAISQNIHVKTWFFSLQFLVFFCIQLFCLVAVLRALKQSGPGERRREREEENHMKRRAFHLILIATVSMAFIYVPYTITGFCIIITQQNHDAYWLPGLVCYVLAGFIQPVLYLQRTGKLSTLCSS